MNRDDQGRFNPFPETGQESAGERAYVQTRDSLQGRGTRDLTTVSKGRTT